MDKSVNPQNQLFADNAIAQDNRKTDAEADKRRAKNEETVTAIANRTEEGKALTPAQKKAIDSNAAVRMLVKKVFADRGLNTADMYVDMVQDSYDDSKDKKIRSDIRLKHRRFVANELVGLEGIHATADDKKRPDTVINLHVSEGLYLKIEDSDGNKAEISSVRPPEGTPPAETSRPDKDGRVWEKGG